MIPGGQGRMLQLEFPAYLSSVMQCLADNARRYRVIYTLLALGIFAVGLWLSFRTLGFDGLEFHPIPLLINLLVAAPAAIALNSVAFQLAGRMIGTEVGFFDAFQICSIATASNVLPIPAGTVFQTSALAIRGAGIMQSGGIIVLGNLASLAIVAIIVGGILLLQLPLFALFLLGTGALALAAASLIVWRQSGAQTTAAFLFLRLARTLVMVFRIQLSFLALGISIQLLDAAAFTGAVALGTTVAVFPAGLGVSESLAALTATVLAVSSASAFVATALNRTLMIALAAAAGLILSIQKQTSEYR